MKRLIVDLDGTLAIVDPQKSYSERQGNKELIIKLKEYEALGYEIVINTSRNMRTYDNQIGMINVHTLPTIIDWLRKNDVPFQEVHVGKPWCGLEGFYIDDRAIRPNEFVNLSLPEIKSLLEDKPQLHVEEAVVSTGRKEG